MVKVEVFNSEKKNPIYTVELDVERNKSKYIVYRRNKPFVESRSRSEAIAAACERILQGFEQPGIYTAYVNNEPYAYHAAGMSGIEAEWLAASTG